VRLKPALFPDRVNVSFILQYFKQPSAIVPIVEYYHSCTRGRRGDAQNPGLTSELVVNVDSVHEAAQWAAAVNATGDFITLVFSPNVHELRGYNRGAAVARGDALVLLQDDDTPTGSCAWLSNLTALLAARPRIGAVGLKKACIVHGASDSCGWAWVPGVVKYSDPSLLGGLLYQYAMVADFSPLAVRASAYADVGGCDEGGAPSGEAGIMLDYELTFRMWAAGWHVTQMSVRLLKGSDMNLKGGTAHGISVRACVLSLPLCRAPSVSRAWPVPARVCALSALHTISWRSAARIKGSTAFQSTHGASLLLNPARIDRSRRGVRADDGPFAPWHPLCARTPGLASWIIMRCTWRLCARTSS
jgi:hypothetical protein